MKKIGIIFFVSIIIVIVALSSFTFAFYNVRKTQFDFIITSGSGSVITFDLSNSFTDLTPAPTNSIVDNYTILNGLDNTSYAVYGLTYRSLSPDPKDLTMYISSVTYSQMGHKAFLDGIIDFTFEKVDNDFVFTRDNIPTPTNSWIKMSENGNNFVKFENITQGTGMILCYVRINVGDELVPPFLNNIHINFTISTIIE